MKLSVRDFESMTDQLAVFSNPCRESWGQEVAYQKVAIAANGRRVGESHPKAKLSDHEVDLIRTLADEGMSYRTLAVKFEVLKSVIQKIVKCDRRAVLAVRIKRVPVTEG